MVNQVHCDYDVGVKCPRVRCINVYRVSVRPRSMGQPRQWDQVIYPGMKHALTCALQVSQDLVKSRKVQPNPPPPPLSLSPSPALFLVNLALPLIRLFFPHFSQNSFELYGADFMLTDDFTPWLVGNIHTAYVQRSYIVYLAV